MKYFLSSSEHVTGPYTREELVDSLKYGMVSEDSKICEEDTDSWVPISTLLEPKAPPKNAIVPAEPPTPFTDIEAANPNPSTVYNNYYNGKSSGVATLLEILPGTFMATFGIGNLYAGNIATGITLMLTYWVFFVINIFLLFFFIGFLTLPATYVIYLVISIVNAQKAADRSNWQMIMDGNRKQIQG